MKLNRKILVLAALTGIAIVSGCALLIGPMTQISLLHKLISGKWTLYNVFTDQNLGFENTKGPFYIIKKDSIIYNYFAFNPGGSFGVHLFTSNYGLQTNIASADSSPINIMDVDNTTTGSYLYYVSAAIHQRLTPPTAIESSSGGYFNNTYLFLSDGYLVGPYNMMTVLYSDFSTPNNTNTFFYDPSSMMNMKIKKSRNKYDNGNIFAFHIETTTSTNLQLVNRKYPMTPMLTTPYRLPWMPIMPLFVEADGNSKLYVIVADMILRYDSASKSLVQEASSLMVNPEMTKIIFINESMLIFTLVNLDMTLHIFDTGSKSISSIKLPVNDATNIRSFDAFYDKSDGKIYLDFVTSSNTLWSGFMLINE